MIIEWSKHIDVLFITTAFLNKQRDFVQRPPFPKAAASIGCNLSSEMLANCCCRNTYGTNSHSQLFFGAPEFPAPIFNFPCFMNVDLACILWTLFC